MVLGAGGRELQRGGGKQSSACHDPKDRYMRETNGRAPQRIGTLDFECPSEGVVIGGISIRVRRPGRGGGCCGKAGTYGFQAGPYSLTLPRTSPSEDRSGRGQDRHCGLSLFSFLSLSWNDVPVSLTRPAGSGRTARGRRVVGLGGGLVLSRTLSAVGHAAFDRWELRRDCSD